MPSAYRLAALLAAVLGALLTPTPPAHAQNLGIATLGATGGLTMPSAFVLGSGVLAFTGGNYQDPMLGSYDTRQNYTLGVGLLPGVEVFGRFANYTTSLGAPPGAPDATGIRDISANIKWQLPLPLLFDAPWLPKVAVGATDVSGGAANISISPLGVLTVNGVVVGTIRVVIATGAIGAGG